MFSRLRRIFQGVGPGVVTGASDDDPSGIATYTQAGARFCYQTLWTPLFTLPLMIVVQEMCARIATVTGKGIVRLFRERYPRWLVTILVALLAIANALTLGADLGMMAASAQLLLPLPFPILLLAFTGATLALQIALPYRAYRHYLKWLVLSLFAYVLVAGVVSVDWFEALRATLRPVSAHDPDYLLIIVAVFGATLSPYLYVWQAGQEVEEAVAKGRVRDMDGGKKPRLREKDLTTMRWDVAVGMTISNLIMWFIILTAGTVLFRNGFHKVLTPSDAAQVLEPLVNGFASALFAAGVIGTGLLAVPVLSGSAAYAVAELFDFREGLSHSWRQARAFYGVITVATVAGLMVNFIGWNPIQALIYAAVASAVIAPPILLGILIIGNDRAVMGKHANGPWSKAFGWFTFASLLAVLGAWWLASLRW